ncbi:hypothetical protein [Pyrobaculum sp.]|uniref:hypothetical protein n=1 Tax=Pyrobaculum sp. TaxID=2004705 RepID=UPI0031696E5D
MDLHLIEARYQRAVFKGRSEVAMRDFMLRYGERWEEMWEASSGASEEDVKAAEDKAGELRELVASRIDDVETAALYAAYGRSLSVERELELGMELLGRHSALEKLIRWGLVMHFSDEVVAAPPYLAGLLLELMRNSPRLDVDLWQLEAFAHDPPSLALLEGLLSGEFDEELHRIFYGEVPRELRIGKIAVYTPDVGIVVNPVYSPEEVLEVLVELKRRRAYALSKALALHGEYEFSSEARCGLHYLSLDGSAEKSGVVAICPWLSYSRKLWRKLRNVVLVVEGQRPPGLTSFKIGVVFIKGGEAEVVKPQLPSKLLEYIVDILYSAGFFVSES